MIYDLDPIRIQANGRPHWLFADGTILPVISGGDGSGDGGDGGNGDGSDGGKGAGDGAAKTFTQADLDRLVGERLARERGKYADYDELKAKAGELDELKAAGQSELDKANDRAQKAEDKAAKAIETAQGHLRRAAILSAASTAGAIDADAVHALLANDQTITVAEDGTVTGVDEAIKSLLEAKPHLKNAAANANGNGSGDGNGGTGDGAANGQQQQSGSGNGSFDGGARSSGAEPLTRTALAAMPAQEVAKLTPQQVAEAMARP